ncbi:MAG: ABC transporter ATP-binding protein [Candidatus Diapherotrites archaeon CG11_big_fil_rev_8_21_14_0_20_37_9]|nr:MAG: ABC transporter ATP-binding protein [Candidatus Diapherotrites archaeon CG11_big_fil_rev_8_21_14_0_20_37_9]
MELRLENLELKLGDWSLGPINLFVTESSFVSIVGPSGSGKTSLLKAIAGLENSAGKIFFAGKNVSQIPPEKRNIGFVFQENSLFGHMTVFENVAFGLKMRNEKNIEQKVLSALETVRLNGFGGRSIDGLSGGEMKRVALARAIAFNPDILLLDEPVTGLDAPLKEEMKVFLKLLQEKTGITTIMVTHDLDEAFYLSDKIIVMNSGKIEQESSPIELFVNPKTDFVKKFVSNYIIAEANAKKKGSKVYAEGKFSVPAKKGLGKMFVTFKKTNYRYME